jgi:hypothetical protein
MTRAHVHDQVEEIVSVALLLLKIGFDLEWWSNSNSDFLRQGTDRDGFISPLFTAQQKLPLIQCYMHGMPTPDPEPGHKLYAAPVAFDKSIMLADLQHSWIDGYPGWEPIDEDGYDDPIREEVTVNFSPVSESLTHFYSHRIMSRLW